MVSTASQGDAEISPYTRSMARCLDGYSESSEEPPAYPKIHVLMNMVQGRMLEFLADEICRIHSIRDGHARKCIVTALLGIFSDEFFALFRSKIEKRPELAILIARRIIRSEFDNGNGPGEQANAPRTPGRLFPAIFRKYFEYRDLDSLLHMVESDAEIQKIILLSFLKPRLQSSNPELLTEIDHILDEDQEGICPNVFMEYLTEAGVETLLERVQTGEWRAEVQGLKEKIAALRGE